MIFMENRNRIVRAPVLKHDDKSTLPPSLWILLVRDFAVVKQLDAIGLREMRALRREHVVAFTEFVRRYKGYDSLCRNFLLSSLRSSYDDQIDLPHTSQKSTE